MFLKQVPTGSGLWTDGAAYIPTKTNRLDYMANKAPEKRGPKHADEAYIDGKSTRHRKSSSK